MKKFVTLLVFIAAIVVSYYYVDRRVVLALDSVHSEQYVFLQVFAVDIVAVLVGLIFLTYLYGFVNYFLSLKNPINKNILAVCNSVAIAIFIRNILKVIFGRYWPATWVCNNPSFLKNQAYGFHWFHSGESYHSFPSGHATFIFAFATAVWCLYPKWRWLAVLLPVLVMCGQVGMYYHFVSDTIAGAGVGILVARYMIGQNKLIA